MNTIYLVRHGENTANITGEMSYKLVDYSLTTKGVMQAQQTATYFKNKPIDEIYASPLKRAKETAQAISDEVGLPVNVMEQFREVNVGALERRPPSQENWDIHNRIISEWYLGRLETSFPEGENYISLLQRMRDGLRQIVQQKQNQHIVVVGHAGIFSFTMRDICQQVDLEALAHKGIHNCSITTIELEMSGDTMHGRLLDWAACEHLSGEAAEFTLANPLAPVEE
jgi:broad specificity phosphatase PhoE